MQPTQRFKKTLLASAVIFGTGITLNASAATFPVIGEAIPDVTAAPVAGFTQVSFGTGVIGNKNGQSCIMQGISEIDEAVLLFDEGQDAANANAGNVNGSATVGSTVGSLSGNACVNGPGGEVMLIEIDGADASTVSVTVNDVTGTGWTYTPTAQSCVVKFSGNDTVDADSCESLELNTVTGIPMSLAQIDGTGTGSAEVNTAETGYEAMTGKTRMILAGSITLSADLGQGTVFNTDNIIVQVTYE
ncbi:hypothetical protein [Paraglaciecola psychrophila]|uniref:Uncharacterized protein n=1 Tax=Paraglaciecola psychrophila 170 TaxID=1129794 RepID=K6ZQ50_9ALTE|nr:hypothetical protein [Paraglaciecola psychrophila]AGH45406.1 hypothetical protein C427_3297 [Paraglaciecola psychrophila 170]GAC38076.1 hypothetical protein GPSY_2460 [Paraglaciecola psychrophila 170]